MAISNKLQNTFHLLEMAVFDEWRTATPERREEITMTLGKLQGQMIIDEINEECNKLNS